MFYAQLDHNGFCIGISDLRDIENRSNLIHIDIYDEKYLMRKYDIENQTWTDEYYIAPEVIPDLTELKAIRYKQATDNLQDYLMKNPLKSSCHGGKEAYYDVTSDVQNKLSNSFATHVMLTQQGIEDTFTWFDINDFCEVWTDAEVLVLMKEMKDYVTEKESELQHIRVQINNAATAQEVNAVNIEFEVTESEEIT